MGDAPRGSSFGKAWRFWRIAAWIASGLALALLLLAVSNFRWDASFPAAPGYIAATRNGSLKVFKDWKGDPGRTNPWSLRRRPQDEDFQWWDRWLYEPAVIWVEFPLWLLVFGAISAPTPLLYLSLGRRARLRVRLAGTWIGAGVCVVLIAIGIISIWWNGHMDQNGGGAAIHRLSLTVAVDENGSGISVRGRPQWVLAREADPPLWLPGWSSTKAQDELVIPLWIPLLLTGAGCLPCRRDARALRGGCANCGYDRRGLALTRRAPSAALGRANDKEPAVPDSGLKGI